MRGACVAAMRAVLLSTMLAGCGTTASPTLTEPASVGQLTVEDHGAIFHPGARLACDATERCDDMRNQVLRWAGMTGTAGSITAVWFHDAVDRNGHPVRLALPWASGYAAIAVIQYQDGHLLALSAGCGGPGLGGNIECFVTQP